MSSPLPVAASSSASNVRVLSIQLPPNSSTTTGLLLSPDLLLMICQWFSPRQLQQLVRTCKTANRVLLAENEGYWTGVAAHVLFRGEFIMELPRVPGEVVFPGFALRMPDRIPQHNLYNMLGMDISRGQAYQLFIERLHEAITVNAGEPPRYPGLMEYVGLSTRDVVLKKFDEVADNDRLEDLMDQGVIGDPRRFSVSMREIALASVDQKIFLPPRARVMRAFTHELEDDQEISPKLKRKFMRKLHDLQRRIEGVPGRVFSNRELISKICRF